MHTSNETNKVVLFLPLTGEDGPFPNQKQPIEILALAGPLLQNGYEVILIDASIRERYIEELITHCEGALCLGISSIFGYQVYHGATVSKLIRETFPHLPIVHGGWFPSVDPDSFLNHGLADVVVRKQGEETFLELVKSYRDRTSIDSIKGITYKKNGHIIRNPDRPLVPFEALPPMPYHLISDDIERYIQSDQTCFGFRNKLTATTGVDHSKSELRILWYYSSYGCPDACEFCCSPGVTARRWIAKDPAQIVDELEELVNKYSYNLLYIIDANFCVNQGRTQRFCEEIIKRRLKIKWFATGEVHTMCSYKEETLNLRAESGCYTIFLGAENADPETMPMLKKTIKIGQTEQAVSRLLSHNIIPEVSYVAGFPDETPKSIENTMKEWLDIRMKHPAMDAAIHTFVPLPGTGFYSKSLELGYTPPKFPEGYRNLLFLEFASKNSRFFDYELFDTTTWVRKAQAQKVYHYRLFSKWAYDILFIKSRLNLVEKILNKCALFRMKQRIPAFPIEFWLYNLGCRILRKLTSRQVGHFC